VAVAERLATAVRILAGGRGDPAPPLAVAPASNVGPDLGDVAGQRRAIRALVIAAAGGHSLLLSGAPGSGKTMLALRLPGLLPSMSRGEALEVTQIAGADAQGAVALARGRPLRAPHPSATAAALVGRVDAPGELALAHNGVLLLDGIGEFRGPALEALARALDEGHVTAPGRGAARRLPARFLLVATSLPCPCGLAGERERCGCTEAELRRHARRLAGPVPERLELGAGIHSEPAASSSRPAMPSATARALVEAARERQRHRLSGAAVPLNAGMDAAALSTLVRLDEPSERLLRDAGRRGLLAIGGQHRILRVARTIADLDGRERLCAEDVGEALALRPAPLLGGERR
jgi:magnesium chelatase family protein